MCFVLGVNMLKAHINSLFGISKAVDEKGQGQEFEKMFAKKNKLQIPNFDILRLLASLILLFLLCFAFEYDFDSFEGEKSI